MKHVIRTLLLGALAWSVAACVQVGAPQEDLHENGMEELLAEAGPGGWIEVDLDLGSVAASAAHHPGAHGQPLNQLLAAMELTTPGGHPLRAVGLLWSEDGTALDADELVADGLLRLTGTQHLRGGLSSLVAAVELDLATPGGTVAARGSLLVVGPDTFFDEADALFLGDLHLRPIDGGRYSDGARFPYAAAGDEGLVVGLLQNDGRELSFGELEIWFSYRAQRWSTPFGPVQWLSGFVEHGGDALPSVALAFDLRPAEPEPTVVVYCRDCDGGEIMLAVPEKGFTATDDLWLKLPLLPTVPTWVTGEDEVPLEEGANCRTALALAAEAVRAANAYRLHHDLLADGADLALFDKGMDLHPAGSEGHRIIVDRLHDAEAAAWGTVDFLLGLLEANPCR